MGVWSLLFSLLLNLSHLAHNCSALIIANGSEEFGLKGRKTNLTERESTREVYTRSFTP